MGINSLPAGFTIIDNVFDKCNEVIEWINKENNWAKSAQEDGFGNFMTLENRTSDTIYLPILSFINPSVIFDMNKVVWNHLNKYAINWKFQFSNIENVSIQRYSVEDKQFYGYHWDGGPKSGRIVSCLLYLNTVDEGGETYFPHFDLSIKPVQGRLAIFPSTYSYGHEAKPPISNMKYAAAYWAHE